MLRVFNVLIFFSIALSSFSSKAETLGSDPRIRTIIFGENDVFKVNSIFGYQTVVEFEEEEKIQTISVGNPNIFKIIPSRNRLFIKAYQNGQQTNMTLITNKRMYQFELTSNADNVDEMMYLVRFIYPDSKNFNLDLSNPSSGPLSIYSPIKISGDSSGAMDIPSVPAYSPDLGNINEGEADLPLSIQYRSKDQRKGIDQSPVRINTPSIPSPFSNLENNSTEVL